MNMQSEESNLSFFKYSNEMSSQLLIQANDPQEFIQIPNIGDDLLSGLEDGTVTWTLEGISGNADSQPPLLISNSETDALEDFQSHQETLKEFLQQTEEINCPLDLSEKNFLADTGLFVANEVLNDDESVTLPNYELVSNEIQSSDVSSQEAFTTKENSSSYRTVLNLNCSDLLFDTQENKLTNSPLKKSDFVSDLIQNYNKNKETVQNLQKEIEANQNCLLDSDNIIKVFNIDGSATILNINGAFIDDKTKDASDFVSLNEPDSTVTNDTEEVLNIDELATVITAYQCKLCEVTFNDRDLFLTHFKQVHIQIPENVYNIQQSLLIENSNNKKKRKQQSVLRNNKAPQTVNIICNNKNNATVETVNDNLSSSPEIIAPATVDQQQSTKADVYDNGYITFVTEEKEKKLMRLKKKKKTAAKKIRLITQEPILFVSNLPVENDDIENTVSNNDNLELNSKVQEKKLIFLCSQCACQFLTVEDCKNHMIKVHKLRAVKTTDTAKMNEKASTIKDAVSVEKNKKVIEKILNQDVLKPRRHRCSVRGCQYRFAKLELLARHESCHVPESRTHFRCPECGDMQSSWRTCSIHLWRCHQLDVDLYACPFCDYKGSTSVQLKHHAKIHSEERNYVCPECNRGFKQPSQLRNHRVVHLENQPQWYTQKHCDKCGKMFADSKCLKKHIQAVHSKLKPFICSVCGHTCARKAMLQMHFRQHTGEKPYSCSLCYYKTGDHNSLRRHKMRHSGTRPYKCPHCDYTAIQSNSYKNHLASKHPGMSGAYNCEKCPFKSVNKDVFASHVNEHKNSFINNKQTGGSDDINKTDKNSIDLEDDETQNCFLSLRDLSEEQTIDTGGITIPADVDVNESS